MESKQKNKQLEKVQSLIEQLALKTRKLEQIVKNSSNYQRSEYEEVKERSLEIAVDISLMIESDFDSQSKRKLDVKIVFESFNVLVNKQKGLIEKEESLKFFQEEKRMRAQVPVDELDFKADDNDERGVHDFEQVQQQRKQTCLEVLNVVQYEEEPKISQENLEKITSIITQCNQISKDQLELIQASQAGINEADQKVEQVVIDSQKAGEDIKKAAKHKVKGYKYFLGALFGGIGTAVGAVFGAGVGGVAGGAAGVAVGAKIGSKLERVVKKKYGSIEFQGPEQASTKGAKKSKKEESKGSN